MLILVSPKSTLENVNICVSRWSWGTPVKELLIPTPPPPRGYDPRVENLCSSVYTPYWRRAVEFHRKTVPLGPGELRGLKTEINTEDARKIGGSLRVWEGGHNSSRSPDLVEMWLVRIRGSAKASDEAGVPFLRENTNARTQHNAISRCFSHRADWTSDRKKRRVGVELSGLTISQDTVH